MRATSPKPTNRNPNQPSTAGQDKPSSSFPAENHNPSSRFDPAPAGLSLRGLQKSLSQRALNSDQPFDLDSAPSSPRSPTANPAFAAPKKVLGPSVPISQHFVWVRKGIESNQAELGKAISAADLATAAHYAARGGNVTLATDQAVASLRTATSRHHNKAGSLEGSGHFLLDGTPLTNAAGAAPFSPQKAVNIRTVAAVFANPDHDPITTRLNALQACEATALGNPGARSDIIRAELLYREGGVYTDFDRAEYMRLTPTYNPLTTEQQLDALFNGPVLRPIAFLPFPAIEGHVGAEHGHKNIYWPKGAISDNNDLIASLPKAAGINALRYTMVSSYHGLAKTPAIQPDPANVRHYQILKDYVPAAAKRYQKRMEQDYLQPIQMAASVSFKTPAPAHLKQPTRNFVSLLTQSRNPATLHTVLGYLPVLATFALTGPFALTRANAAIGFSKQPVGANGFRPSVPALHDLSELRNRFTTTDVSMYSNRNIRLSWVPDAQSKPRSSEAP